MTSATPLATSFLVNKIIDTRLSERQRGTNHDVYDKRLKLKYPWQPFTEVPKILYFYYVRVNNNGTLYVTFQEYADGPDPNNPTPNVPIPYVNMENIVKILASRARPTGGSMGVAVDLGNMVWDHKSYIALFVDEANWRFHKRDDGKAAIVFNVSDTTEPNVSFFDAEDLEIEMPINDGSSTTDIRTAIYFVNHMKANTDGDDLQDDQKFKFDMFFDVDFTGNPHLSTTVIIDPGGTNDGPP